MSAIGRMSAATSSTRTCGRRQSATSTPAWATGSADSGSAIRTSEQRPGVCATSTPASAGTPTSARARGGWRPRRSSARPWCPRSRGRAPRGRSQPPTSVRAADRSRPEARRRGPSPRRSRREKTTGGAPAGVVHRVRPAPPERSVFPLAGRLVGAIQSPGDLGVPWSSAAASTISARITSRWGRVYCAARRCSSRSSASLRVVAIRSIARWVRRAP